MKIAVESVSQKYGKVPVLHEVSFTAEEGEVVALLGTNGSGKSTLIKTIADILRPFSGRILIDGVDASTIDPIDRAKLIGYVPQYFHYTPFTTVLDTVLIGRRAYMSWSVTDEDLAVVDASLATMHFTDLAGRFVNELSRGQRFISSMSQQVLWISQMQARCCILSGLRTKWSVCVAVDL